jgi:glutamine synthetase
MVLICSTGQAEGNNSDCILKPVFSCPDPIRGGDNVLVLCEVLTPDGKPHPTNTRRKVVDLLSDKVKEQETLFGFEQEYTMFSKSGRPYGWPESGYPAPQGPFYCGVGLEAVYGRPLVEAHLDACVRVSFLLLFHFNNLLNFLIFWICLLALSLKLDLFV